MFFLIEAGFPADGVLLGMVSSINGLKNQESSIDGVPPPKAEFLRVLHLMRTIQLAGALGLRVEAGEGSRAVSVLTIHHGPNPRPEDVAAAKELRNLLGLDESAAELKLVFGAIASDSKEIAVVTRSLIRLMQVLASQIDVPPDHLAEGRALGLV